MTAVVEGGEWSAARHGRTLPPGKTRYPFYRRLGGPQGRSGRAENLVPTVIRFRTVQYVVSRDTDWATRPTQYEPINWLITYRGADKSSAQPGRKQASFPAFYGTWRFITTITTVHHLPTLGNQFIPLSITLLTDSAFFLPGRAKDLSATPV
jgi:hypothetical protein